ncbi:MAG: hypothetical protein IPM29_20350 [Planctomycetes bacterium]|nr:hypothetical protein [Planctomycetota bacterium]
MRWLEVSSQVAVAQTFVVDAAGGPGAHVTSIAAPVAAVPDDSALQVRPVRSRPAGSHCP